MNDVLTAAELSAIRNSDKLLPGQPINMKHFRGMDFAGRLDAFLLSMLPAQRIEDKWDIVTKEGMTYASLGTDINTLHFYQMLIKLCGFTRVLELGTYIGVSTLFLAEAVGPGGYVATVERGEEFYQIAMRNLLANNYGALVSLIEGDALDTLRQLAGKGREFDLILSDAAKEDYGDMLEPALACLSDKGLLLFDDVLMHGDTLNAETVLEKTAGVHALLEKVRARGDELSAIVLPIGNGLLMVRRR